MQKVKCKFMNYINQDQIYCGFLNRWALHLRQLNDGMNVIEN